MKQNIINSTKTVVLAILLATGVSYLFAWTGPFTTPPGNNVSAPLNAGTLTQTKIGPLVINFGNLVSPGLEVLGGIQIVDGTQGVGKVLISDANGVATWQTLTSADISTSTAHGQQLFTNSGTFTVPVGVTQLTVSIWGAGGGGSSGMANEYGRENPNEYIFGVNALNGANGGSGAAFQFTIPVVAGGTYPITVGSGGVGGTDAGCGTTGNTHVASCAGSAGSSSIFGTVATANGGGGATGGAVNYGSPLNSGESGASAYDHPVPPVAGTNGSVSTSAIAPTTILNTYGAGGNGGTPSSNTSAEADPAQAEWGGFNGSNGAVLVQW